MGSTESEVFLTLANWLAERDYEFYVHVPDNHHQTGEYATLLEQFSSHSIKIGPYSPDILGYTPSNRVFAVEVKGVKNLRKGLGQAISYQRGVDHAYLATDHSVSPRIRDLALGKGIGILEVPPSRAAIEQKDPYSVEMRDLLYNTRHQLDNLLFTANQGFNRLPNYADPLNQLMPVVAIAHHNRFSEESIGELCEEVEYPYRSAHKRMIRLAISLGIIKRDGEDYLLTEQGYLGQTLLEGYGVREIGDLMDMKPSSPLWQNHPPVATYLRNRFASNPDYRTLFEVLLRHGGAHITIRDLCKTLIDNYPSTFLNLVYSNHSDDRGAPELIEQGRGNLLVEDSTYLSTIIRSQFISNTASQFRSLGILTSETPVIGSKPELDPETDSWYPRRFQLG